MTCTSLSSGLSIVLPVHNEAAVVEPALLHMLQALSPLHAPFEIVVVENGSRDDTLAIVGRIAAADPRVRVETLPVGDYGHALQHGIQTARFDKVVIFNVDYWSAEFVLTALDGLASCDIVVGSKVLG